MKTKIAFLSILLLGACVGCNKVEESGVVEMRTYSFTANGVRMHVMYGSTELGLSPILVFPESDMGVHLSAGKTTGDDCYIWTLHSHGNRIGIVNSKNVIFFENGNSSVLDEEWKPLFLKDTDLLEDYLRTLLK